MRLRTGCCVDSVRDYSRVDCGLFECDGGLVEPGLIQFMDGGLVEPGLIQFIE